MGLLGRVLTAVLTMVMIPLLILSPALQGQGVTTVTSLATITTPSTITITRTVAIQETSTRTTTTSYSTTTYLAKTQTLRRETISLNTFPHPQYGCYYEETYLKARKDQVLSINFTSTSEITFFMMTARDWREWVKTHLCRFGNALVEAYHVTSYYTDFVIPEDGSYYFLFLNFLHDTRARVRFSAKIIGSAGEASSVITTTMVMQKSSTETETLVVTVMRTITSIRTEAVGFPPVQNGLLIVALVLLVTISVVVGIALRRRRREKAVATAQMGPMMGGELAAKRVCINCGAELPAEAKFCTECGSPTS